MKGIFRNLHRYVLWAIVSIVFWAWIVTLITDAPAGNKVILYADLEDMDRKALSAALEQDMPENIRFVEPLLFEDAMFEPGNVMKGDMFIVPESRAREALPDLAVVDRAAFPGRIFLESEGKAYGILVYDEARGVRVGTGYLAYEPGETYYLLFNAGSLHLGDRNDSADDAALRAAHAFMTLP